MAELSDFLADFDSDPGYLDYASIGPLSVAAQAEQRVSLELLGRARFGGLGAFAAQDERMRTAVAAVTGFSPSQVVAQPNTSMGLMHAMFGMTGSVLISAADFPSLPFAAVRAAESMHVLTPVWLDTDGGRVTPHAIKEQLTPSITAVAVSLVDSRTGYLADIEGIRQVIGDRLLIVDAIQGFTIVDAPFEAADVVVSGGRKWARAGWGTGFMALSDRALEHLVPVVSGYTGTDEDWPWDSVPPPTSGAAAYSVSRPDPTAEARFAASLELVASVGISVISEAVTSRVSDVIELADEFGVAVASSRAENERAGIVVLDPPDEQVSLLVASLHNHGVTATARQNKIRLSVHAGTSEETLGMLRDALVSFQTAVAY
ncbi:selenocysteine lyase/cysteine desulfurase [Okibacterium sp. HSC-33S16]|uniref:aminotransferase class V-fold PLP-dependent enzyme n=1 Tax=Okibacterium sp. HSC-33S16 TaxID=2910965 RepID=UPI0020A0A2FE|nr:aminotransferase class V-fold PLP-dependent enzyme [Okibacterium sp. HSC-33S16]MCP2030318.1 selenocysteine lyase/cysteine desulfurase [Okibacterium sp. HSC-33S16]